MSGDEIQRKSAEYPFQMFKDASDVDVEESLLRGHQPQRHDSSYAGALRYFPRLNGVLVATKLVFYISATIFFWIYSFSHHDINHPTSRDQASSYKTLYTGFGDGNYGLADDVSGQVPSFAGAELEIWMFWNDSRFTLDNPVHATKDEELDLERAWKSIVPEGNGFITVGDPSSPVLPPPINQPEDLEIDRFCLTVWHQLHCLRGIQEGFYNALKDPEAGAQSLGHVNHCIDYIRQGVMCYGDTALEGQSTYSSEERANGNAANHVCKDFTSLLRWSNERSSKRLAQSMRLAGHVS